MKGYTVQVNNVSSRASVRDLQNFFSFSGRISHIDLRSDGHWSQVALVTFKDAEALDTAVLLSGATIVDQPVSIMSLEDVDHEVGWEEEAVQPSMEQQAKPGQAFTRAQDVVASMVAKGYILGKDALNRAKSFDERHQFSANAASRVSSLNKKISFSERLNAGASIVNTHVQSINERYHITDRTFSAYSYAQEGIKSAGSAVINNKVMHSGSTWVSGAFYKIAEVANNITYNFKDRANSSELPKVRAKA